MIYNPSAHTPDGKIHVDGTAFYVAFRNYASRTGEEYFTILSGDWSSGEVPVEWCSLGAGASLEDQKIILKNFKSAHKQQIKASVAMITAMRPEPEVVHDPLLAQVIADYEAIPKVAIYPLGFKEKEYFFTSTQNRQIVTISKFAEADLFGLAPIGYWEAAFPGSGASRVDWSTAKSAIMEQARSRGIFQPRHVRGTGVWNDEGRIVVNMGDHLVVDGVRVELGQITSRYFYTLGSSLACLHAEPLTSEQCNVLIEACDTFRWLKSDHGFLMAGALVVSRVCGALPVRPHTWITGGASTGKTTLLERLIQPIIGESVLYVQGNTTEAGIRQSLKADAIPVVFDEFETTGQKSGENVNAVVELLRSAWSDSSALIVKGGSGGNATAYQVRCSAFVSSIRTKLTNDADRQRFAIVELAPHGSDGNHWKKLNGLLGQIDHEYGERLFARTITMIPTMLANFKVLKKILSEKVGARFADQYGMLMAGYSVLMQDGPLTIPQATMLADHVQLLEEKEEAKVTDHENALTHLLTKKIQMDLGDRRLDFTIEEAVRLAAGDVRVNESLQRFGIKVTSETVAIASQHNELESIVYRGTRWSNTWANSLSRVPGAEKNKTVWISGGPKKCVVLPKSAIPS